MTTLRMFLSLSPGNQGNNWDSYDPGDVAVIHPEIPSQDVDSFLSTVGWSDIADSVYTIDISLRGKSRAMSVFHH
jgi:sulfite reductase alpha subunit-like flavoprotein